MIKNSALIIAASVIFYAPNVFSAKPIVVAVIDTGIGLQFTRSNMLCKYGHRDFTQTSLVDTNGHGTHISGLIDQYAKNIILDEGVGVDSLQSKKINYCQVVLKFFDRNSKAKNSSDALIKALRWAIDIKVDVINVSAGGYEYLPEEYSLIKEALDHNIKVVVAGGNDGCELGSFVFRPISHPFRKCSYYPAMYDNRAIVVGNHFSDGAIAPSSNYGDIINDWEWGSDRTSYSHIYGLTKMSGTSQATAVKTGKIVRDLIKSN